MTKQLIGFELECITKEDKETIVHNIKEESKYKFEYGYDGQLSANDDWPYAHEFRPLEPMEITKENLKHVKNLFDATKPCQDIKINYGAGGHIHIDVREMKLSEIKSMLIRYIKIKNLLHNAYALRRFYNENIYGTIPSELSEHEINNAKNRHKLPNPGNGYKNQSDTFGSIEFRFFDGFKSFDDWKEKIHVILALANGGKVYTKLIKNLKTKTKKNKNGIFVIKKINTRFNRHFIIKGNYLNNKLNYYLIEYKDNEKANKNTEKFIYWCLSNINKLNRHFKYTKLNNINSILTAETYEFKNRIFNQSPYKNNSNDNIDCIYINCTNTKYKKDYFEDCIYPRLNLAVSLIEDLYKFYKKNK